LAFVQGQPGNALRERNLIDNSSSAIDDVIEQAQASLSTLTGQREMFEGMGAKLNQLGNKYPAINSLMNAIRRKRSKDTIVLSAVIACCTLFLLIYWLSK
jgi:Golgi SNAP receptor complex protein 1